MSYKVIAALGDSIVNGYWDEGGTGWFGRLSAKIAAAQPYGWGFHNMSMDGDRVCDSFHRLSSEALSREIDILLISASGNDLVRRPDKNSPMALSKPVRAEYWHRMLDLAKKNIPNILVIGTLPHRNEDTPALGWFDAPMYELNSDLKEYDNQVAEICASKGIPFMHRLDKWEGGGES